MTQSAFPVFPGLTWSVTKTPQFKTQIQTSISGREYRLTYQPIPRWLFTVKYEFLRDGNDHRYTSDYPGPYNATENNTEYRQLVGFFLQNQGSLSAFWFWDPSDNFAQNQYIATGNGIDAVFPITRNFGGFNEPIFGLSFGHPQNVYIDGAPQPGQFYINSPPSGQQLGMYNAPPAGSIVTMDFHFFFTCRFVDDTVEFENFMWNLWSTREVKLLSVMEYP